MNKILNFGSLNLDIVYTLEHIVRPGETLAADSVENFCGGKGFNQSIALARSGGRVWHAGRLGADGDMLEEALLQNGVDCSFLARTNGRTGNALIQREHSGQNSIMLYGGANREITTEEIDRVLSHFSEGDLLISQNEISHVPYLLDAAWKRGMKLVLNPSPIDGDILRYPLDRVTWLVINEIEGAELSGVTEPGEILDALLARYPGLTVVLTLGGEGAYYADSGRRLFHKALSVPVVDTTAAGDTFLGYLTGALAAGTDPQQALHLATGAAALAVTRAGAYPSIPTREETEAFLSTQPKGA